MDVVLVFLHICLQIMCASGQQCIDESPIPPVVPPTTWTAWFSVDDPTDGTDDETLASVRNLYPSVCRSPSLAECRVRFLHEDHAIAGQTFAISCTPTAGLLCQNSDQFGQEACIDYEIRFECPSPHDTLPEPHFYWDLSTKPSLDDDEPLTCDGVVTSVYPNIGGMTGTVVLGTLGAADAYDSSDHLCAVRRSEPQSPGYVVYGEATGKCITETDCCTSGWSITFWMRYRSVGSPQTRYIFQSGGQTTSARGLAISLTRKFSLLVRGDSTRKAYIMKMADASIFPPEEWTHHCFTYNLEQGTKYYRNGDLLHSLVTPTIDSPYTMDIDEVSMFGGYYRPEGDFSDFKMFYKTFNETEVQELYLQETSKSSLVIYYIRQYSHNDSFDVELECLAKSGSRPNITWYRSDDGAYFNPVSPSSEVAIYESLPNNYRRRSVLMVRGLNFANDVIFVCEASDIMKGGAVSKFVTIVKRDIFWTPWLSADEPSDGNDRETLTDHQQAFNLLCDNPTDIQCRTVYDDIPSVESGQTFDINCTVSSGLVCVGADQISDSCYDYKVRYSCLESKFRWTTWYDTNKSNNSVEDETFDTHALQSYTDLCSQPIGAECRVKGTNEDLIASGIIPEAPYLCNANGFRCQDADNTKPCPDFEVRYRCPTSPATDLRITSLRNVGDQFDSTLKLECSATIGVPAVTGFSLEWAWFESHRTPLTVKPLVESALATISSYPTGQCCQVSVVEIEEFYNSLLANKTIVCTARDGITVDYKTFKVDLTNTCYIHVIQTVDLIGSIGEGVFTLDWYHTSKNQRTVVVAEKGRYQAVKEMLSPTGISMSLEIVSFSENDNCIYICSVNKGFGTYAGMIHLYGETTSSTADPGAPVSTSTVRGDVQSDGTTPWGLEPQRTSTIANVKTEDVQTRTVQQSYVNTNETPQSTPEVVTSPPQRVETKQPSTDVSSNVPNEEHITTEETTVQEEFETKQPSTNVLSDVPNEGHITTEGTTVQEEFETKQPSTDVSSDVPNEGHITTEETTVQEEFETKQPSTDVSSGAADGGHLTTVKKPVQEEVETEQPSTDVTSLPTTLKPMTSDAPIEGHNTTAKNSVSQMKLIDSTPAVPTVNYTWLVPVIICTVIIVMSVSVIGFYIKKKYISVQPLRPVRSELHAGDHCLDYRPSNQIKAEIHLANTPTDNDGI